MMRAIGRGAKRAHGLFALAVAAALAADPLLVEAQNNPARRRDASASSGRDGSSSARRDAGRS